MKPHGIIEIKEMLAESLVEDLTLYPRMAVDDMHVREIEEALANGSTAARRPIRIDEKTRIIIDGMHRRRAHLKHYGADCTISAEIVAYPNRAAMFRDAMELNSEHGKGLNPTDRTHCILLGEELCIRRKDVAQHLKCSLGYLDGLVARKTAQARDGSLHVVRASAASVAGRTDLTKTQVAGLQSVSSSSPAIRMITDLIKLFRHNLIMKPNDLMIERLTELEVEIDLYLTKHGRSIPATPKKNRTA